MMRSATGGTGRKRSSSVDRSSLGSSGAYLGRKRSSSMERSSLGSSGAYLGSAVKRSLSASRPSVGRQSVGPLRVRNEEDIKISSTKKSFAYGGGRHNDMHSTMGGGKLPLGVGKTPQGKGIRRGSQMGVLQNGLLKDPRKISDRSLQAKCAAKLVEFLSEKGYPQKLSPELMKSPSRKDFMHIFEFLYSMLSPNYKVGKKPEDEIPKIFKQLGYPFMISKTYMFAIGSQSSWPAILAAIVWMVDLIKFGMKVGMNIEHFMFPPSEDEFDSMPEAQILFDYVEKTYSAFLDGQDSFEEYDESLRHHLNRKIFGMTGGLEKLDEDNKKVALEMENLEQEVEASQEKLKAMQEANHSQLSDIKSMEEYLTEMANYNMSLEKKLQSVEEDIEPLLAELESVKISNKEKQDIFEAQDLSPADIEKIKINRKNLQRQIDDAETKTSNMDKEIWADEMKISKLLETMESYCNQYNDLGQRLKLIPVSAQNACGIDYEIYANYKGYLDSKFTDIIKPALLLLKDRWTETVHTKSSELMTEKDTYEQVSEYVTDLENEIAVKESQIKRMEEDIELKKKMNQEQYQKWLEEKDALSKEIVQLNNSSQKSLEDCQKELREAHSWKDKKIMEFDQKTILYEDFLKEAIMKILKNKTEVEDLLERVNKDTEEKLRKTKEEAK